MLIRGMGNEVKIQSDGRLQKNALQKPQNQNDIFIKKIKIYLLEDCF